jgi:hypothetical protein
MRILYRPVRKRITIENSYALGIYNNVNRTRENKIMPSQALTDINS